EFCRKRRAIPLGLAGNSLRLAVADATDYSVLQDVEFKTGRKTVAVVVTQTWLENTIRRLYPELDRAVSYDMLAGANPVGEIESANEAEYDLVDPATLARETELPPIVRLVNMI